ncbi:MAG: isoprenylcysteine carboxylmethyltransferase family protein [Terriglobales bacterium]
MSLGAIWRVWFPLLAGAWALWWVFTSDVGLRGPVRSVGLALGMIGLAGVIVARYTLGRSFSVTPQARALVTTGIYSRIRNPIYISAEILLIGIAIMLWKLFLLLLALVVIIPMQIWRARREARVLEGKFGDEYRDYRRQTWF